MKQKHKQALIYIVAESIIFSQLKIYLKKNNMKKSILTLSAIILFTSCGWHKIGTLTMASNRNVDTKTEYVLIKRYVTAKVKNKGREVIQGAIDEAVKETPGGEYMMNVKFYIKSNGKKIKVEGDVWGLPGATNTK